MSECMTFPKTADEFIEQYKFTDTKQEYTNGAELISVFRVQQMMEHYFASDNNVGSKWIPVTERLPEKSCYCLCYWKGHTCRCKYWRQHQRFEFNGREVKVTHWMPLPEPPKGE